MSVESNVIVHMQYAHIQIIMTLVQSHQGLCCPVLHFTVPVDPVSDQ